MAESGNIRRAGGGERSLSSSVLIVSLDLKACWPFETRGLVVACLDFFVAGVMLRGSASSSSTACGVDAATGVAFFDLRGALAAFFSFPFALGLALPAKSASSGSDRRVSSA